MTTPIPDIEHIISHDALESGVTRKIPHKLSWTGLPIFNQYERLSSYIPTKVSGTDEYGNYNEEHVSLPMWEKIK